MAFFLLNKQRKVFKVPAYKGDPAIAERGMAALLPKFANEHYER
jgi:hypothetical protein